MPFLYLSPSTREFQEYVTTGTEESWMNAVADQMVPYLRASGVNFTRNNPDLTAADAIRQSNAGSYDFHLALRSGVSPRRLAGALQGIDVFYSPESTDGLRMANLLVDNLKPIYLYPDRIRALPTSVIREVSRTRAPAALAELGYHDNLEDAAWVAGNTEKIARALALSVTEFFGLPFLEPQPLRTGRVVGGAGTRLRGAPSPVSPAYLIIPGDTVVTVYGSYHGWYVAEYRGVEGYAAAEDIVME